MFVKKSPEIFNAFAILLTYDIAIFTKMNIEPNFSVQSTELIHLRSQYTLTTVTVRFVGNVRFKHTRRTKRGYTTLPT